jgi:hypothetical protein
MVALVVVLAFVDCTDISVITFFVVDTASIYRLINAVAIYAEPVFARFRVAIIRFLAAVQLFDVGA